MAYPIEHKTVFVLDKSPHFAKSCKESIEYDALSKVKAPGVIPSAPITKSLWTCNVETMVEYMRIVYDIFPTSRMVSISKQYWSIHNIVYTHADLHVSTQLEIM